MAKRDYSKPLLVQTCAATDVVHRALVAFHLELRPASARHLTLRGYLVRVIHWFATLRHLDNSAHYQAFASAHRALIEIAVDSLLVHHSTGDQAAERIEAWEHSAEVSAAQALHGHLTKIADEAVPAAVVKGLSKKASEPVPERTRFWSGKHPPRWSGFDLLTDMRKLDSHPGLCRKCCEFPSVERVYHEAFRPLCWDVHGSALAGSRMMPMREWQARCASDLYHTNLLALMVARVMAHDLRDQIPRTARAAVEGLAEAINGLVEILAIGEEDDRRFVRDQAPSMRRVERGIEQSEESRPKTSLATLLAEHESGCTCLHCIMTRGPEDLVSSVPADGDRFCTACRGTGWIEATSGANVPAKRFSPRDVLSGRVTTCMRCRSD